MRMTKEEYLAKFKEWLDTSPTNRDGEVVVAHQIVQPGSDEGIHFRCLDDKWPEAFNAWANAIRHIDPDYRLPHPMPTNHLMFVRPISYGYVALGETRPAVIQRAIRNQVVSNLNGWDRDLRKSIKGMRHLAKIVRATVKAKFAGESVGAAPYLHCILALV